MQLSTYPLLVCAAIAASIAAAETAPVKPCGLKPGDTIMFVAPAGEANMEAVKRAKQRLEEAGFRVRLPADLGRQRGYLAGTDRQRADELMAAFTNREVDAVFPVTGGYGVTRMLDLLDYDLIAENPKLFIGFSDITGLHMALGKMSNLVTIHSPNPQYGLGSEDGLPEFHAEYFWKCVLDKNTSPVWELTYHAPNEELPIRSMRPGTAHGRLVGGNLSLITALEGTPYAIETNGKILFLEDIREKPYRVDRMLSQLKLAGKLDGPAAVILGAFYKCDPEDERTLSLQQVLEDYFADAPYPVVFDFPAGHGPWNAALPLGIMAEVDGSNATVRLLECPLQE